MHETRSATGRLPSPPEIQSRLGGVTRGIRNDFLQVMDLSKLEKRVLAAMPSTYPDPHTAKACELFGVPPHQVTPDQRRFAKIVNYQHLYGDPYVRTPR